MIDFRIKPDNGEPFDVTADSRDVAAWERGGKSRSLQQLGDETRMTDLYQVAHLAATRTQQFNGPIGQFESTCVLDFTFTEDAEDPTTPEA